MTHGAGGREQREYDVSRKQREKGERPREGELKYGSRAESRDDAV